jgi:hypothetical protein
MVKQHVRKILGASSGECWDCGLVRGDYMYFGR